MQRVYRSTRAAAKPAAPAQVTSPGYFTGGDPGAGTPATVPGFEWFNGMQETVCYPIEQSGQTLDKDDDTQLYKALFALGARPATPALLNGRLEFSVAGNALTGALKHAITGADPSASAPVYVRMRSATAGSGATVLRSVTSALSFTISSGSTMGHNSGLKQYLYWYLIDNAGVIEIAAASKYYAEHGIVTTVAEGGAGAADSGLTMYSASAQTNAPFLAVALTEDTQATAGTWAAGPSMTHPAPFNLPTIGFSAHRNGTDQTPIPTATNEKIKFNVEAYDNGGLFDSVTNFEWIPPPGRVEFNLAGRLKSVLTDQGAIEVSVRKNGAALKAGHTVCSGTGSHQARVSIRDECNGTDKYTFVVAHNTGLDEDLDGDASYTWVMGNWGP